MRCELEFDLGSYCRTYFTPSKDKSAIKIETEDKGKSREDMDLAELITTYGVFDLTNLNSVLG